MPDYISHIFDVLNYYFQISFGMYFMFEFVLEFPLSRNVRFGYDVTTPPLDQSRVGAHISARTQAFVVCRLWSSLVRSSNKKSPFGFFFGAEGRKGV